MSACGPLRGGKGLDRCERAGCTSGHRPPGALLLEEHSSNTAENASMTQALLQPRGVRRVLLVTSALHMARARAHFEAVGFEVIPAPTDHEGRITSHWPWWKRWLPSTDALGSQRAGLEGVGGAVGDVMKSMLRYRWS